MSTQVHQVHRAEISGYCHQRHASGSRGQHYRAAHIHPIEHEPYICRSVVNWAAMIRTRHHVFPSAQVVRGPNRVHRASLGDPALSETHGMDADTLKLVDGLPCGGLRFRQNSSRHSEQGSIQREV